MFYILEEILRTGIRFLTELFSGRLDGYSYTWCLMFILFIFVYSYTEERPRFTARNYSRRVLLETLSHLIAWIAGILIARFFAGVIDHGVSPMVDSSYYAVGLLMLIAYDLSVIFSLATQKININRDASELSSFLFGLVSAYFIFLIFERYRLPSDMILSHPYKITLSILGGLFAWLFKLSQRTEGADRVPPTASMENS